MPTQIIMPQLGESVVEGTLTKWLKAEGDHVEKYEALVEINTDKVDTELPSPVSGVLQQILVENGATVQAGTLLGMIGDEGEKGSSQGSKEPEQAVAEPAKVQALAPASPEEKTEPPISSMLAMGRNSELGFISPLVARLAQEHAIDLRQVTGTGLEGRITKQDVLSYLEHASGSPPTQKETHLTNQVAQQLSPHQGEGLTGDEIQPLSILRRKIAEHMVFSKHTSPHVTTVMEADLSQVVAHRQLNKADFAAQGANLTYAAYFVSAAAQALRAFPLVNASWNDQGIVLHRQINIGLATALEDGLIVPVIRQADNLSLLGVARAVNDLAGRARARKLHPDEVHGGTFTITNHGVSGSLFAMPIINQPQCAILGAGVVQKRVVVLESETGDSIAIHPMVYLSLTFDHRILDGAVADHFLAKVVELLQNWRD